MNEKENKTAVSSFFEKRPLAVMITAAVIAVSLLAGGRASLMKLQREAYTVYENGDDGTGLGIVDDLEEIRGNALNLTVVAERYLAEDRNVAAVKEAAAKLEEKANPKAAYQAVTDLMESAEALADALEAYEVTDADERYIYSSLINIESYFGITQNSNYNDAARAYNAAIKKMPAGVIRLVTGVKALALYE